MANEFRSIIIAYHDRGMEGVELMRERYKENRHPFDPSLLDRYIGYCHLEEYGNRDVYFVKTPNYIVEKAFEALPVRCDIYGRCEGGCGSRFRWDCDGIPHDLLYSMTFSYFNEKDAILVDF